MFPFGICFGMCLSMGNKVKRAGKCKDETKTHEQKSFPYRFIPNNYSAEH